MGCDIHAFLEVPDTDGVKIVIRWHFVKELDIDRSYGLFGFLANVRNYSRVPCITGGPRGMPPQMSDYLRERGDWDYGHSHSWLSVKELMDFDYDQTFEDRRCIIQTGPNSFDGSGLARKGGGKSTSIRSFLGLGWFSMLKELDEMYKYGRIVFWFDC